MHDVNRYLEDLEERIKPEVEDRVFSEWFEFTMGRFEGQVFRPKRDEPSTSKIQWPKVKVNDALEDLDLMVLQQYGEASGILANTDGLIMNVRGNYGTSIIPLLFGVEPFIMEERLDTLPTSLPLARGLDDVRRLLDAGIPDVRQGFAGKALTASERFLEISREYPKIGKHVHIYHPDTQGPVDVCEVLLGSRLFLDVYDEPQLVQDFLDLITETYIKYLKEWFKIVPPREDGVSVHWSLMHRGTIMLRDDSAMNFSPEMYTEFVFPYDQRCLNEFGGGAIHFCGKGDHFIEKMSETIGYNALAMSQPEMNDMEKILQNTVDKGVKIIGFPGEGTNKLLESGRTLHSNLHSRPIG